MRTNTADRHITNNSRTISTLKEKHEPIKTESKYQETKVCFRNNEINILQNSNYGCISDMTKIYKDKRKRIYTSKSKLNVPYISPNEKKIL